MNVHEVSRRIVQLPHRTTLSISTVLRQSARTEPVSEGNLTVESERQTLSLLSQT